MKFHERSGITKAWLYAELLEGDPEYEIDPDTGILVRVNPVVAAWGKPNTVVANGKQLNAQRLFGVTATQINTMAIGTDSTASSSSQTQLNPSVAGSTYFQAFDSTPTVSAGVATCVCTIGTANGNFAIAEVGMFNGTTNGTSTMLDRIAPIGPITKSASFSLALTITYTQG